MASLFEGYTSRVFLSSLTVILFIVHVALFAYTHWWSTDADDASPPPGQTSVSYGGLWGMAVRTESGTVDWYMFDNTDTLSSQDRDAILQGKLHHSKSTLG